MHREPWTPPRKDVKQGSFNDIVSVRGPLLTFRQKDRLWVVRAGDDPRAWFMPVDKNGRGAGQWLHGRPWMDELLRPVEAILRTRGAVLSRLRRELRQVLRWACQPDPDLDGGNPSRVARVAPATRMEFADPATLPHLARAWPELHDVLALWEQLSLINPRHARLAFARLRKAEGRLRRIEGLASWLGHFSPEALAFVERHGFKERRWHLLNLWLRVPEGRDLFDDTPALAWMMASSWLFRKPVTKPFRSLRSLVRKPRNHVLQWLDLPPGDGTLKLLRMLPGMACEMLPMIHYHAAFRHPTVRGWLLNLGVPLTRQILDAAVPGLITYPILQAVAHQHLMPATGPMARDPVARIYFDVRSMMDVLPNEIHQTRLGRIRTPRRLWEYHEELVARRYRGGDNGGGLVPSSWEGSLPPPAPAPDWMQPLDTAEAVQAEGSEMRHCLSGYVHAIADGRYYGYAVHHEQGRATLGLSRLPAGGWRIDQLRGTGNSAAPAPVRAAVEEWAGEHRIQLEMNLGSGPAPGRGNAAAFEAPRQLALECELDLDEGIPF